MRLFWVLVTLFAASLLSQTSAQPVSERRVALAIGVTDYDAVTNLTNPRVGARQVYEALRATGFDVPAPLDSPTKGTTLGYRDNSVGFRVARTL